MLYVFGFRRLGVVLGDLYFEDPQPGPGQEGPERGVRLEVRVLDQPGHEGSVYASRPIVVGRPVWRVDLLETVDNPGSLDRAHHHPNMHGWEPARRRFDRELTADPLGWVAHRLENFGDFVGSTPAGAELLGEFDPEDFAQLRDSVPDVVAAIRRLLDGIGQGELALAPAGATTADGVVRSGWM